MLVGLDYWYTIMGLNVSTTPLCEGQQLVIHHTPLGNVPCGRLTNDNGKKNERSETMMADIEREPTSDSGGVKPTLNVEQLICNVDVDYTSNEMMQCIWGLDGIGTNEPKLSGRRPTTFQMLNLSRFLEWAVGCHLCWWKCLPHIWKLQRKRCLTTPESRHFGEISSRSDLPAVVRWPWRLAEGAAPSRVWFAWSWTPSTWTLWPRRNCAWGGSGW